jgi:hypothetical protein
MTSEPNEFAKTVRKVTPSALGARSKPKVKGAGVDISRVRAKVSELTDEEKDKLLFEVFDMLLEQAPQARRVIHRA